MNALSKRRQHNTKPKVCKVPKPRRPPAKAQLDPYKGGPATIYVYWGQSTSLALARSAQGWKGSFFSQPGVVYMDWWLYSSWDSWLLRETIFGPTNPPQGLVLNRAPLTGAVPPPFDIKSPTMGIYGSQFDLDVPAVLLSLEPVPPGTPII